jgi:multidrug resistance efflux pump
MKLRSHSARITTVPDTPAPTKKTSRVALLIYLFLLALTVLYIFFYFLDRSVHYAVRGRVERELFPIETDVEGRLVRFLVADGEPVVVGQPVAIIRSRRPSPSHLAASHRAKLKLQLAEIAAEQNKVAQQLAQMKAVAQHPDQSEVLVRLDPKVGATLIKARRDIALQRADLNRIQLEENTLNREIDKIEAHHRQQRALELQPLGATRIQTLLNRRNELARKADGARTQIEALTLHREAHVRSEIESLKSRKALLARETGDLRARLAATPVGPKGGMDDANIIVKSPLEGQVALLYTEQGRFCRKGESLLALARKDGRMRIDGYFPLDAQPKLTPGTEVAVIFPDGYKSSGTIGQAYSTALPEPVKVTHKYVPVEVSLTVEIHPQTEADAQRWAGYDQMDVRLKVTRWL